MTYEITHTRTQQFRKCQATIVDFDTTKGTFKIFYSYLCPKIVKFPSGNIYKFTFENSRKEGQRTESQTTSKQCNAWLGYNHRELENINLEKFEKEFFDTRLENYGRKYY